MIEGPLEFGMVGVISGISAALARADIPLFVISTFDTDYVLVKSDLLEAAFEALTEIGYEVNRWQEKGD